MSEDAKEFWQGIGGLVFLALMLYFGQQYADAGTRPPDPVVVVGR